MAIQLQQVPNSKHFRNEAAALDLLKEIAASTERLADKNPTQEIPKCPPNEECITIISAILQIALIYASCLNKTGQVVSKEMKGFMGTNSFTTACEYLRSYHDMENDFKSCCKHQTKKCTPDVVAENINFCFILIFKVIATYQNDKN